MTKCISYTEFQIFFIGLTLIGLYLIVRKINKPRDECVEENVEMLMSKLKYQKNKKYICKKNK